MLDTISLICIKNLIRDQSMCIHFKFKYQLKRRFIAVLGVSWGGRLNQNSTIFVSWRVHFLGYLSEWCSRVTYESSCLVRLPQPAVSQTTPQKARYLEKKSTTYFHCDSIWNKIIRTPKMCHFWNPSEGKLRLYHGEPPCCLLLPFLTTMLLYKKFCHFLF